MKVTVAIISWLTFIAVSLLFMNMFQCRTCVQFSAITHIISQTCHQQLPETHWKMTYYTLLLKTSSLSFNQWVAYIKYRISRFAQYATALPLASHWLGSTCRSAIWRLLYRDNITAVPFWLIQAHITTTITASKKCSITANRKLTMGFPTSLSWRTCIASKSPKGAQKCKFIGFFEEIWSLNTKSLLQSFSVWKLSASKL